MAKAVKLADAEHVRIEEYIGEIVAQRIQEFKVDMMKNFEDLFAAFKNLESKMSTPLPPLSTAARVT